MTSSDHLERGRTAYERRAWAEALELLVTAGRDSTLPADDLERLATAAYLSGHDQTSIDAWSRAHHARLEATDVDGAVRCAFWLAFNLIQRGAMAEGGDWLTRAERLVDEHGLDCVECGYLLVPRALMFLGGGRYGDGFDVFERAGAIADRFADVDLQAISRLGRGQASYGLGRPVDGAGWFDEAMAAVTNGEVSPVVSGIVYCAVIDECQRAFDVGRARAWTSALSRWCDAQPSLVPYRGQCLVHRSQVLQLHGAWHDAFDEAQRARDQLSAPPHPAIGMAHYQLGELQRLRGDLDDAEGSYGRAEQLGRPAQPGLALLLLERGVTEAAAEAIDCALVGADDPVARTRYLPAYVEIMLSAGRIGRARDGADELVGLARAADTPYLDAAAATAEGAVELAVGDPQRALDRLRTAASRWWKLEIPYEAARTQSLIASACRAVGDDEAARREEAAARRTLAQLGAVGHDSHRSPNRPPADPDPRSAAASLSPREVQVLRRVAEGRTNREIADDLFISAKTVERHLSNVFVKLGAPNRAAATAIALDAGVL